MFSTAFWKDAGERAGKTFAQTLLAALLAGATLTTLSWPAVLVAAGTATAISVLTSVVSLPVGNNGTASMLSAGTFGRHQPGHVPPVAPPAAETSPLPPGELGHP